MGQLTLSLIRRFKQWERSVQIAVVTALVLFVVIVVIAGVGPQELRLPAVIGIIGLMLVLQVLVLWANRDMVTAYTEAQRAYLRGDFEAARAVLEAQGEAADARALTLLGNTYRQLGKLEESEQVLGLALAQHPGDQFPLYGLGRTLMAQGRYAEAADRLEAALKGGAPDVVQVDLAEAYYRLDDAEGARRALAALGEVEQEPYRRLIVAMMRWRLGDAPKPDAALVGEGIAYWQATAERFGQTAYGAAVAQVVRAMEQG